MIKQLLTNSQILELCKDDESYKSLTSKLTDEIFTEAGFEAFSLDEKEVSNFFKLTVRVYLQKISRPNVRIPKAYKQIVEEYGNEFGGIAQRINSKNIKPISPRYRNLQNGGSVDPYLIRKPEVIERFFKQNMDYQNLVTMQEINFRKIFLDEYGINNFVMSILAGLDESYALFKFEFMREMLHKIIHSTNYPLQNSQKIIVPIINEETSNKDMSKTLQILKLVKDDMDTTGLSGAFNALKYKHGLYPEDYVLLVRADAWTQIQTTLMATTYHDKNLTIDFPIVKVKDFGGIYYTDTNGNVLQPVYDEIFGDVKGFNLSGEGEPLPEDEVIAVDPNKDTFAVLAQRGVIFTTEQNGYTLKPILNPAGEYTNFWANKPNASMNYDPCYDFIQFIYDDTNNTPEEPTPEEP